MNNKKNKYITIIIIILIFAAAAGIGCYAAFSQKPVITSGGGEGTAASEDTGYRNVTYNGKEYEYNSELQTLLFLGVDTHGEVTVKDTAGYNGQADCIIVMIMNTETKETKLLMISRESMVDIAIYTVNGEYYTTEKAQIALQYAYGDGENKSNWLMKNAVSELLDNIPINACLSINIDGIPAIVNALGGVELTIPKDYTAIDPSFVEGAAVTLDGEKAERYVRYRDTSETGSNIGRMERQSQFIPALISKAKAAVDGNEDKYSFLLSNANPYMTTDLDAEGLKSLASYKMDEAIETVPGEVVLGAEHDEYIVNHDNLQELIIKLFYNEK